ncbi:MAG: MlaE family lipid ABC transporter permease subunit [Verrucomicrobiota bacterium]|jgi:phospholipid/cholesterol/gamma-HCH transport system permease protein
MTIATQNELETDVEVRPDGRARVVLRGRLNEQTVVGCWGLLEKELLGTKVETLQVDVSGLGFCDAAGMSLLLYLNMGSMTPQATVSVFGLEADHEKILRELTSNDHEAFHPHSAIKRDSYVERIGRWVGQVTMEFHEQMVFLGTIIASLPASIFHPKRSRWTETRRIVELAGANAVPIVSLMSLLLGFIIAFESARRLAEFGAQLYVANTIMVVMVRDMGPLMTAILLAGRSGSSFAAEIGTMKVNEELNALKTFGLDPIPFLVVPRILAGVFVTPLLTFYSILMGVIGGVIVMLGLGFTLPLILHQLASSVHLNDLGAGISKSAVFGVIVSAVGCWHGLRTQQGPSAVGLSTTRAVVTSLLLIIVADAFFSAISFLLK